MIRSTALRLTRLLLPVVALMLAVAPAFAGWRVVLVAGDNAEPVFDNGIAAMARQLSAEGVQPGDIRRLSASPTVRNPVAEPASVARVLNAIATLGARPGDRCFVFVTSHGQHEEGVWLAYSGEFLRPADLSRALAAGCGSVPTVVVVSACYSGLFTGNAMRAPNRIVLTAARADRPSFGCAADRTYTVFDECLLGVFPQSARWRDLYTRNLACVHQREKQMGAVPSGPQAYFGPAVRNLGIAG